MNPLPLAKAHDLLASILHQNEYLLAEMVLNHRRKDYLRLGDLMTKLDELARLSRYLIDYVQEYPRHWREALEQVAKQSRPVGRLAGVEEARQRGQGRVI